MLLALALMRYHSRAPGGLSLDSPSVEDIRRRVSLYFRDVPSAPLSIHRVEDAAVSLGCKYATWLSPSQAGSALASVFKALKFDSAFPLPSLVYSSSRVLSKADLAAAVSENPIIILIPLMLGLDTVSGEYQKWLLRYFTFQSACGVAGGRGSASLFFFGCQGSDVLYFDPHYVQKAFTKEGNGGSFEGRCGSMHVAGVSTSMLVGFFIRNVDELEVFCEDIEKSNHLLVFPLISIVSSRQEEVEGSRQDIHSISSASS
ncbi:hypothetical protein AGDE_00084 [Angomonas deanei]|nr:hypothetical protein AGDE_00084 [Angomonas deanei]|eukprot:EPY43837.1 hypothetical protein AGDE_00084 [Angomonas deanei]